MRCYLCVSESKLNDLIFCHNCEKKLQNILWISCARCGKDSCYGCEELNEFRKVFSLITYSYGIPEILVLAKDYQDYNAQLLFKEMFFNRTKNYLKQLIIHEQYNCILISPLRKERIMSSNWHPFIFFEKILNDLKKELAERQIFFQILTPLLKKKSHRQAMTPSHKRNENSGNKENLEIFFSTADQKKISTEIFHRVLLIDDVLTSGQTAKSIKKVIPFSFEVDNWDLFTLFRSHQS
ncbi:hypothetical protein [Silvanigrella aquatica]|uniref:Phosphoribosyltransferase domain-containing protein n=1 Tax=Silvanigrella aquatica TaxID=1915309 RepID=A0A1L4CXW4_9BACT|nr:hypothetical protein [Silvanigrella aquatica]APJ02785.1 hypothetical protein AXG55_02135 [Silvanigrella aquatica]